MGSEDGCLRGPAVAAVRERGDAVVVELQGELDLHNAEDVRKALEKAAPPGAERVVVDLGAVEFLDSTVLGVLLEARRRTGEGVFRLAAPPDAVRRTLHVTGVDTYLDVFETVDAALG